MYCDSQRATDSTFTGLALIPTLFSLLVNLSPCEVAESASEHLAPHDWIGEQLNMYSIPVDLILNGS